MNNIIWRTGNDGILVIDSGNDDGLILKNNCYWKTTGSGEFKISGIWYNYCEFKSRFDLDHNSLFDNPLFIDISKNNFSLSIKSPCIERGGEIPDEPSFSPPIDIGAVQTD